MSDSPHLALPYLAAAQAQKHVTVNESLSLLDGLVHLSVISRALTSPPATPFDGDRYLVPAAPTGDWTGHVGQLALRMEGAWRFLTPRIGWRMWVEVENVFLIFDGTTWVASGGVGGSANWGGIGGTLSAQTDLQAALIAKADTLHTHSGFQNLDVLGVNAIADAVNKLSVNSSAALFNNIGASVQIKLNKNIAADTASLIFQTAFSGRAEIGTTGDDNFHFKVSADGTAYFESFLITGSSGLITLKNGCVFDPQASDPVTPANGQIWYNSTLEKFRKREAGISSDLDSPGGGIADGDKGDITVSATGATWTIDAQSVTYGKIQNISATDRLLGRQSSGAGVIEEIPLTAFGRSLLDDVDAPTVRTTLGLGTAATSAATAFALAAHTHTASQITDFNTAADARIAAASINALSDVVVTAAATGQVLKFNGTNWINDTDATGGGGGQATIQFQEEGTNLGATGTVDTFNIKGDNLLATRTGNMLTLEAKRYRRTMRVVPVIAATAPSVLGLAITGTGTGTAYTPTPTSLITQQARIEWLVTTAATTAIAAFRTSSAPVWRGNGAGLGGFHLVLRVGNATGGATATTRGFFGVAAGTGAPTDVEPSTLLNMLGIGWDAADTNVQLMTNDGAGAAVKVDLGTSFPVPNADRGFSYELELWCAPFDTVITYKITSIGNAAVATGTVSADLPANNILLGARGYISVGGTSSIVGVALMDLTLECDY